MKTPSVFCEHDGKVCSRRTMGTFGFLCCVASMFSGVEHPLQEPVLWASMILLGATTADQWINGKKKKGEIGDV